MSPLDYKHINYQTNPKGIHGRRSSSIQDWNLDTGLAMQSMPLLSPETSGKQQSSSSPTSDTQFEALMAECAAIRNKMNKIEDKIAELYYARQIIGNTTLSASSDTNSSSSASQKRSREKGNSRVGKQQESASIEFYNCEEYSHLEPVEDKVKNKKAKKPKTEEEKNRHINMIFIRENP